MYVFNKKNSGFTLIELLIAMAIIGILASIVLASVRRARENAYVVVARQELRAVADALNMYLNDYGTYPDDVSRDIPPGLELYLAPGSWPDAAWPGSVFDWENWAPGSLSYNPKEQVYQISIRFCPLGKPDECRFPNQEWAKDFDIQSSVYYCIQGPCRSHSSRPTDHPGYCVNC